MTAPSEETALQIARGAVEQRLAACATVVPSVRSIYRWRDEICDETEVQLIFKTRQERIDPLFDWIRSHHPYEVPEILAVPVAAGSSAYLDWLLDSTTPLNEETA